MVALSDGVFAIALTLLVLTITTPELRGSHEGLLGRELLARAPRSRSPTCARTPAHRRNLRGPRGRVRGATPKGVAKGESGRVGHVEPGARHTFRNESGSEVAVKTSTSRITTSSRTFAQLRRSLGDTVSHPSSPGAAIRIALLWGRHEDLIRPADPPLKAAFPVLRGVGRMAGMSTPA
jgi:hypothetical protein